MRLIIRADAMPHMGTGHVMRCMALALELRTHGMDEHIVSHLGVDWLAARLAKEELNVTNLAPPSSHEPPQTLLQQVAKGAEHAPPSQCWVVLDGYHFGLDCQQAVREAGYKLMVIDDYAHLPEYSCDILLNQNIDAEEFIYKGQIGLKLFGLGFILIHPQFRLALQKAKHRILPEPPQKILLNLGGGDNSDHLKNIAYHFNSKEMHGRKLQIIAGAMPFEKIHKYLCDCPAQIEILSNVGDMPSLLLDTDMCITAAGGICWELCYLGVPLLCFPIAENQKIFARKLKALCPSVDFFPAGLKKALETPVLSKPMPIIGSEIHHLFTKLQLFSKV